MWRRTYLLLLALRVYFALSPSYLHPDENFQGPEVFAGMSRSNAPVIPIPIDVPAARPASSLPTAGIDNISDD
jgi:hypothetical protein